eukprot:gene9401-biopygen2818
MGNPAPAPRGKGQGVLLSDLNKQGDWPDRHCEPSLGVRVGLPCDSRFEIELGVRTSPGWVPGQIPKEMRAPATYILRVSGLSEGLGFVDKGRRLQGLRELVIWVWWTSRRGAFVLDLDKDEARGERRALAPVVRRLELGKCYAFGIKHRLNVLLMVEGSDDMALGLRRAETSDLGLF